MRKTIIAGNWKMNTTLQEAETLAESIITNLNPSQKEIEIILCPPFTNLASVAQAIQDSPINLGAQNIHQKAKGAYTGEISASMLQAVNCSHVIIGHSERREHFKESNTLINKKLKTTLSNALTPIFCIGETLEQRENNQTLSIIGTQLSEGLSNLENDLISEQKPIIIAYEPIWAIGTGKVATPQQAQEVHKFIREKIATLLSHKFAENTSILYGGSVKPDNSQDLMSQTDIDGALVGGASLSAESFLEIIQISEKAIVNS